MILKKSKNDFDYFFTYNMTFFCFRCIVGSCFCPGVGTVIGQIIGMINEGTAGHMGVEYGIKKLFTNFDKKINDNDKNIRKYNRNLLK